MPSKEDIAETNYYYRSCYRFLKSPENHSDPKNIANSIGDKSASPSVRESKIIPIRLYYYSNTNEVSQTLRMCTWMKRRELSIKANSVQWLLNLWLFILCWWTQRDPRFGCLWGNRNWGAHIVAAKREIRKLNYYFDTKSLVNIVRKHLRMRIHASEKSYQYCKRTFRHDASSNKPILACAWKPRTWTYSYR